MIGSKKKQCIMDKFIFTTEFDGFFSIYYLSSILFSWGEFY